MLAATRQCQTHAMRCVPSATLFHVSFATFVAVVYNVLPTFSRGIVFRIDRGASDWQSSVSMCESLTYNVRFTISVGWMDGWRSNRRTAYSCAVCLHLRSEERVLSHQFCVSIFFYCLQLVHYYFSSYICACLNVPPIHMVRYNIFSSSATFVSLRSPSQRYVYD